VGVAKRPGSTVGLWPDRIDRFGRLERMEADVARPGRPAEWPVLSNEKERALCQLCAAGHGLNADRSECRPPKMAVCGCNANLSDTANYGLAV